MPEVDVGAGAGGEAGFHGRQRRAELLVEGLVEEKSQRQAS